MKIDNSTFSAANLRTGTPPQKPATSGARVAEAVSLSTASTATAASSEKPPVNAAKIQEIKDAIANGRFKINPEAIADGLLETARDLVNSQRKA